MAKLATAAYRDDLAYIHDVGFGHIARAAAEELLARLPQGTKPRGLVVDLGCGSGILAERITAAGYPLLGFDLSAQMIAVAKSRAPRAEFRCGSFLDARLPDCQAVTAIGEVFNYLFDGRNSQAKLAKTFERIHAALEPGGLLMFDFATPGRVGPSGHRRQFIEADDWACLVDAREDTAKKTLERQITSFRRVGKLYRRDHEVHRLRLYTAAEMIALVKSIGFRVRRLNCYHDQPLPPGWTALVAQKARGLRR